MAGKDLEVGPRPIGRPTIYTQELADRICELIANGETIRMIVAMHDMPVWSTIWRWQREHPEFSAQYTRAREASAEMLEAEIIDVARTSRPEYAQSTKVLVDTLKWVAARRNRKLLADKEPPAVEGAQTDQTGSVTVRFVKGKAPQTDDGDPAS
ncbi:terminase small subunit-like protein [Novacetimonas pomaceti]|uniref:terminase small subunit-like protein n=1 Tax=Novacetimonas pomaceti TaxID=2021998 RepID=UPI001C2DCD75|nr:hypothetical protein [Novacetimonas pomaceti]MBV1833065.1 hypothetical protein [Novacetimonas pomaceti]